MSSKSAVQRDTSPKPRQHNASDLALIDELVKKLCKIRGATRQLDAAILATTDPQATRAQVSRGEAPCLPLSVQRQGRCDTHNALVKIAKDIDELMILAGVEKWVPNRN